MRYGSAYTDEKGLKNGYDYTNQAWVVDGVYVACGHAPTLHCSCYGKLHAGEKPAEDAEIH